jgi:hypothetical protein
MPLTMFPMNGSTVARKASGTVAGIIFRDCGQLTEVDSAGRTPPNCVTSWGGPRRRPSTGRSPSETRGEDRADDRQGDSAADLAEERQVAVATPRYWNDTAF